MKLKIKLKNIYIFIQKCIILKYRKIIETTILNLNLIFSFKN
jgi:hypothetical protein